jgi:hypothetical protein
MTVEELAAFDPAKLIADAMKSLDDKMNVTVNGAIKGVKTDFEKSLDDKLAKFTKTEVVMDPATGEPKTIAELNSALKGLQATVEKTQIELKTERELKVQLEISNSEKDRVSSFDRAIGDFAFASPKAKQQFRDSNLNRVIRDDQGNLVVKADDGTVLDVPGFAKLEYEASPHLQPTFGKGGSGAQKPNVGAGGGAFSFKSDITVAEINALPKEQKDAYRQQVLAAASEGGH